MPSWGETSFSSCTAKPSGKAVPTEGWSRASGGSQRKTGTNGEEGPHPVAVSPHVYRFCNTSPKLSWPTGRQALSHVPNGWSRHTLVRHYFYAPTGFLFAGRYPGDNSDDPDAGFGSALLQSTGLVLCLSTAVSA